MAKTITAANTVYMLTIPGVYNTPVQLQGFSADDIFSTDPVVNAEAIMGVDGYMSAGYVPAMTAQSITLQADSDSNLVFENWSQYQKRDMEIYYAQGLVRLPSLKQQWTLRKGVLTSYPSIPDAGKTLRPRRYQITWEATNPASTP